MPVPDVPGYLTKSLSSAARIATMRFNMRTSKLLRFTVAVTIAASAGRANAQASAAGGAK